MELIERYEPLNAQELWTELSHWREDRVEEEFVYLEHNLSQYFSKTLKNPPNDPDGTELFGETVNLGWKSSSPFEVFMDEEPGGNSDDPVVLENLKEKFRHSTIGELTGYYVLAEQQKKYISRFLSKLGIKNIPKDSFHTYFNKNIVSVIKQTNRGFNMLFTARRAPMDFALVEDKSAYRRHQRFIWSTLDSLVRSRAIDDSIRTDVFLAVECRADVEAFRDFINQTMVTHAQYLSRVVKTANRAVRDNEALGGNENENENEEDNEGNENEEDNETENESGNENEEAGPEADPAGLETDQEADSDDV
ncbi:hypothetical protein H5410_036054 [Solanum commersonii]|uniref:Uncharacterized protein n=1 Tax=Solanum commersonii TaxID=4109 RepID=A0A9J5Y706_SOLCO|nr:hypothetical protein H5410_036054 [Solanum commersonii]